MRNGPPFTGFGLERVSIMQMGTVTVTGAPLPGRPGTSAEDQVCVQAWRIARVEE